MRIEKNFVKVKLPEDLPEDKSDNRILMVCKGLETSKSIKEQIILVTKDILLRIKAQSIGLKAEDFEREQVTEDDALYTEEERCTFQRTL